MAEEYEPYGPEWAKEMMKLPKAMLISMYRKKCLEVAPLLKMPCGEPLSNAPEKGAVDTGQTA